MNRAKAVLGVVVVGTVGGIVFVHWRQQAERAVSGWLARGAARA
jgi:hypothetical protein